MKNLLILASGSGSNAENIARYFSKHKSIRVAAIGSNKTKAYVLERAKQFQIPTFTFSNSDLREPEAGSFWEPYEIDYIILAGFLLKIPEWLIHKFTDRIINIHPALLPQYGGKGMYGMHVHQAVYDNREKQSGITIHLVNEQYDEGRIIFQANTELTAEDQPNDIAQKIHALEYQYFPAVIEDYIQSHSIDS
jgi:phosphoribosylglycinamide formyltransferase-1